MIFFLGFQLWYETCTDIRTGSELVLGSKEPLDLQDMFGDPNASADDFASRETGKISPFPASNEKIAKIRLSRVLRDRKGAPFIAVNH